jgi:hypothetical protein
VQHYLAVARRSFFTAAVGSVQQRAAFGRHAAPCIARSGLERRAVCSHSACGNVHSLQQCDVPVRSQRAAVFVSVHSSLFAAAAGACVSISRRAAALPLWSHDTPAGCQWPPVPLDLHSAELLSNGCAADVHAGQGSVCTMIFSSWGCGSATPRPQLCWGGVKFPTFGRKREMICTELLKLVGHYVLLPVYSAKVRHQFFSSGITS